MKKLLIILTFCLTLTPIFSSSFKISKNNSYIKVEDAKFYFKTDYLSYKKEKVDNIIFDNKIYNVLKLKFKYLEFLNIDKNYFGISYLLNKYKFSLFTGFPLYKINNKNTFINYNTQYLYKGFLLSFSAKEKYKSLNYNIIFNLSYDKTKGFSFSYFYSFSFNFNKVKINYKRKRSTLNITVFHYIENPFYKEDSFSFKYDDKIISYHFLISKKDNCFNKYETKIILNDLVISNKEILFKIKNGDSEIKFKKDYLNIKAKITDNLYLKLKLDKEIKFSFNYKTNNILFNVSYSKDSIEFALNIK